MYDNNNTQYLSKKKLRKLSRMKLSDLKQLTPYPEVVESWDITSYDPTLLIHFKSKKNTVPVPKHWAQKRKYLQSKRGTLRPPFQLPDYIEETGINKIRNTDLPEHKSLSQKLRERMQPKLGRMDIDYQIFHDAFFKYQTKPQLTIHGEVYYENKEFENKMKKFKPGKLSKELRTALGLTEGAIPQFVANMARYGAPPSYPNLKIPGVNIQLGDPTEKGTEGLWGELVEVKERELVWDFAKGGKGHWGDLREDEDNDGDDDDGIGGDEDDLEISDEERADVGGLFDKERRNGNGVFELTDR